MATPYVTSGILLNQPAGLSWNVVPTLSADTVEQRAQLDLVCQQVTSQVDTYLDQPLRAVAITEESRGPGMPRFAVDRVGIGTLITRNWPIIAINAIQVSQARSFPPAWSLVPANQSRIVRPVLQPAAGIPVTTPSGGNAIEVAPHYLSWDFGRGGQLVSMSTTTGYPHTGVTTTAQPGGQSLTVDDVTGWAGWSGWVLDGASTEPVTVTAAAATMPVQLPGAGGTVQAGPGTLSLAAPLTYTHNPSAVVTAIPQAALEAAATKAAVIALKTIAAIAVQSSSGMLPGGLGALAFEAEASLDPFRRIM